MNPMSESAPAAVDAAADWVALRAALLDVSRQPFRDYPRTLSRLLQTAAEVLRVERVSLWLVESDRQALRCSAMWKRGPGFHHPPLAFPIDRLPNYLDALDSLLVVDAADAAGDPRTREFAEGYLEQHGIAAMLDVPVRSFGELVGVLCHEHVGAPRRWQPAEQLFAAALAIAVSQLLEHVRLCEAEDLRDRAMFYDAQTGLANRALFLDRLRRRLDAGEPVGLACIEIDRFEDYQRALRPSDLDALLFEAATRVAAVAGADGVGRLPGGVFALAFEAEAPEPAALALLGRLRTRLAEGVEFGDRRFQLTFGAGVVGDAAAYRAPDDALRDALVALAAASRGGRGGLRFFDRGLRQEARASLDLEGELRRALEAGEFAFALQPMVAASDGRLLGAEALLRWRHPIRGVVAPDAFLAVADEVGLLPEIHRSLLPALLAQLADWRRRPGCGHLALALNIDARQLADSSFAGDLLVALVDAGLPGAALHAEITESVVLGTAPALRENLARLAEFGVGLFLDDFGTGFASLVHLAELPLRGVKIDRSFVDRTEDPKIATLIRGLAGMSRGLGLQVVAEGVESASQTGMLADAGCDALQGYLYGRPVFADAFAERWLPAA